MLWDEVEVAQQRNNQLLASEAILTQAAVSALLSKEGAKVFQKAIKRLTDDD
jgi:arginine repressor